MKTFPPNLKLMALSWKQPYADLMLHGKIETRTWSTNYRGWVLICASKKKYTSEQVYAISGKDQVIRSIKLLFQGNRTIDSLPTGVAIAIGYLSDCRPMLRTDEGRCFVQFDPNFQRYCHVYTNVQAIKPFAWKGTQGWKEVPQKIKEQIKLL